MTKFTSNTTFNCDNVRQVKRRVDFKNAFERLSGVLILIFILLFTSISIPVYLIRFLVILLAKLFRPDLDDILNGLSSLFANDYFSNSKSPRASLIISLVIEGHDLTLDEFKEMITERWVRAVESTTGKLKFKQFQQYPVRWMGFTFWKKCTTFHINNHVYEHNQDNDMMTSHVADNQLNNICEMLLNASYAPFNSPWEAHLVKNYKTGNVTKNVLIFKVHHCLTDGYSILTALIEGLSQKKLNESQLPVPRFPKRNVVEQFINWMLFPLSVFYEFPYAFSQVFHANPWKIPDEMKDWYQVCAKSDLIPIEKVKFIKTQLEVSFTSVLLSAISSGINSTFPHLKSEDNVNGGNNRSIYCTSTLPLTGHPKGLTNYITATLLDLPIVVDGNSLDRLRNTNSILETSKNSCIPICIPIYFSLMGCHFYPVGKFFGKQRMTPVGLSNFPSVSIPVQVEEMGLKCVVADFLAGGLDGSIGVVITVTSYNGNIRVAVTAEKAVMSKEEVKRFTNNVTAEIDRLYEAASSNKNGNAI